MKTLYESILDDEKILINNANNIIASTVIYNKIINGEQLTKIDIDWINNKVGVYKINKNELEKLISTINKRKQYSKLSLNWLNVNEIVDMSNMFNSSLFNGDISKWDVSNVENMDRMFYNAKFNGDISKWDISNVEYMQGMFSYSDFNRDISKWEISSKCDTYNIFIGCSIKDKYKPKNIKDKI